MSSLKDFSLHILDLAQNSLRAGATFVRFFIDEQVAKNLLIVKIEDNGHGMSPADVAKVMDPFFTTRTARRVGLGIPLFAAAAKRCDGGITIKSELGKGTIITATFALNHWDKPPLGDIAGTLITLIAGNCTVDFHYRQRRGKTEYRFDTRKIKEVLKNVPINNPKVLAYLEEDIRRGLAKFEVFKN